MHIYDLIKTQEMYGAEVNQTVLEVARTMVARNIGAVPVDCGGGAPGGSDGSGNTIFRPPWSPLSQWNSRLNFHVEGTTIIRRTPGRTLTLSGRVSVPLNLTPPFNLPI